MTVTSTDLATYVGAGQDEYADLLADCLLEAVALVEKYLTTGTDDAGQPILASVPEAIQDRAVKEVAADLFNRRNAPNGIVQQQFATTDGYGTTAMRINRDPMAPAYPILRRWVLPW